MLERLAESIRDTANIADGYVTGRLYVEEGEVGIQCSNGEEIILNAEYLIEVYNDGGYELLNLQQIQTTLSSDGWPGHAGLYARCRR